MLNESNLDFGLENRSLVFNAGSINNGDETTPDTVPLGTADSSIRILGWLLPQGDTEEYSLTFSVPRDASSRGSRAKVFVHLLTDNSNTPTGTRFSIRLSSVFARADGVVSIDNLKTTANFNILIQDSPGNFNYNHYVVGFDLCEIVRPEDFALLSVARISANDDFAGALLLTSIEFRYTSS